METHFRRKGESLTVSIEELELHFTGIGHTKSRQMTRVGDKLCIEFKSKVRIRLSLREQKCHGLQTIFFTDVSQYFNKLRLTEILIELGLVVLASLHRR